MSPRFKTRFAWCAAIGLAAGVGGRVAFVFSTDAAAPLPVAAAHRPLAPRGVAMAIPGELVARVEVAAASDEELLALARRRVATSPEDALARAESQADPAERERLLFAIVSAWAEADPVAAARWALAREHVGTERFMEAALTGAARRPALAMEIGRMLLAADPEVGAAHGATLVGALTGAGEFTSAFQFARAAPVELREEWLAAALRRWAAQKPEAAVQALDSIGDASLHASLLHSVAAGWAERDPAGLAAYALGQPLSPDRDLVLAAAMLKWNERDPTALATWLNTLPRGREFDAGAAMLVRRTDQANRSVEVALHWVESISTPTLRRDSLQHVLTEWGQTDPVAARAYLESITWLAPDERAAIRANVELASRNPLTLASAP